MRLHETASDQAGDGIDGATFRAALRHAVTSVTVVTVDVDGAALAMTVGSFTSVSLSPPLVLFCAGRVSRLGERIDDIEAFTVNVLGADQQALSAWFAGLSHAIDPPPHRFVPWPTGPRLDDCVVSLGCRVETLHEAGDHWIIVGRVEAVHQGTGSQEPLVFYEGRYTRLAGP